MKKFIILLCLFLINIGNVFASNIYEVSLNKCVDGDTAKFNLNDEVITARFLAIDTPESVHPTKNAEPYGKEASEYTCSQLSNAKEIKIEYDNNSDKLDKYNRHLVWIFVNDQLLQKKIIDNGYAKVAYLYENYKYTNTLKVSETIAKNKKINIWSNTYNYDLNIIVGFIILLIILFILYKNKIISKSQIKKIIKKALKN